MKLMPNDYQMIANKAVEVGLYVTSNVSHIQEGSSLFACAKDTPDAKTFRYSFTVVRGDESITVSHFVGPKQYTTKITLDQFLKIDEQTIVDLMDQARAANAAYDGLENQLKQLKQAHRANVADLLRKG